MTGMIQTMQVNHERMKRSTEKDFSNATELADYLAGKGIPFRQAHEIVGKLVSECLSKGIYLQDIPLEEYQAVQPVIEADIYDKLDSIRQSRTGILTAVELRDLTKSNRQIEAAKQSLALA